MSKYIISLKKEPHLCPWYKGNAVQVYVLSLHHYPFTGEFPPTVLLQDRPPADLQPNPDLAH